MAIHAIGSVIAGFAFARFITRIGPRPTYALILGTHGLLLIVIALWGDFYWTAMALMFVMGLAFNAGRVLNTSLTAIVSNPEQRGVFMAVVGHLLGVGADDRAAGFRTACGGHEPVRLRSRGRRNHAGSRPADPDPLRRIRRARQIPQTLRSASRHLVTKSQNAG